MRLSAEQRRLAEDNLALVHKVIRDRVHGAGIGIFTYEDLYQIGCVGLCKAALTDKFQYTHNRENAYSPENARFSTYAYRLIWNEICTHLEYSTKARAESAADPGELAEHIVGRYTDAADEAVGNAADAALNRVLADAGRGASNTVVRGIRALRYMAEGHTSSEIAMMMGGASCHNVTAWISRARKYLRANPELAELIG